MAAQSISHEKGGVSQMRKMGLKGFGSGFDDWASLKEAYRLDAGNRSI
jgi:hypothetical protein